MDSGNRWQHEDLATLEEKKVLRFHDNWIVTSLGEGFADRKVRLAPVFDIQRRAGRL